MAPTSAVTALNMRQVKVDSNWQLYRAAFPVYQCLLLRALQEAVLSFSPTMWWLKSSDFHAFDGGKTENDEEKEGENKCPHKQM